MLLITAAVVIDAVYLLLLLYQIVCFISKMQAIHWSGIQMLLDIMFPKFLCFIILTELLCYRVSRILISQFTKQLIVLKLLGLENNGPFGNNYISLF